MKKIISKIKLNLKAESANPAPPVGSSLGVFGINIMDFCKRYNNQTKNLKGIIPVHIKVYSDKSFSFQLKLNPTSEFIKSITLKNSEGVKGLDISDLVKISSAKIKDLNTANIKTAVKIMWGSVKNMGLNIFI